MGGMYCLVAVLLIVDSLHFVFARLLLPHIAPSIAVFYVIAIGTVEVGLFGFIKRRIHFKTLRRHPWFFLSIGALIGASTLINYEAVAFIDPGTASLLAKASILMSFGLGVLWLREKLVKSQFAGAFLAIAGVILITYQSGDYVRLGALLILLSAFMYALHTAIVKRFGGTIDFVEFFFFRLLATGAVLLPIVWISRSMVWPTGQTWGLLFITATVDVTISRSLFYLVLRRMKMSVHSIVLTFSPVVAVLWSLYLFGTMPTDRQLIGGIVILIGVLIVNLKQKS